MPISAALTQPHLARSAQQRAAADVQCSHCGLPVPSGLVQHDTPDQFCCHGCETAYRVINSCGLQGYYRLLRSSDNDRAPVKSTRRAYAEFDDPTFRTLYCRSTTGGLLQTELLLEGVHCSACIWLVEKLPQVVPGVVESRLDFRRATVRVTIDPAQVELSRVGRTLDSLGYPSHPARGPAARDARRIEDRKMLVRLAVAGACAGNIMLLFFALYAGMFEGIEHGYEQMFRWVSMGLNTICLAWPGWVFGKSALAALRTRTIHLDVPIALGLYLGGAWGIWKTIAGTGDIYFDSISALIFFLLIGRYVQQRQQRFAADAIELLFALTPAVARRVRAVDGQAVEVPAEALQIGDIVEVRPGESIPADGVIVQGVSEVDLALLTGESRPVRLEIGESVAAGATNMTSLIRVRVDATGEATRVGKLLRLVEDASRRRAAIVRLADRWGAWLLWILLALAAATLALWWHAGPALAIDRAAALLIATCPCGLGLATPLMMTVAIGRAARQGMLLKGGDALQSLADARHNGTIILDKTGTITMGRLSVVRWVGDPAARSLVAALESHSSHPTARALTRDLSDSAHTPPLPEHIVQHAGAGIEGIISNRRVIVGTRRLMCSLDVAIEPVFDSDAQAALAAGYSPVYIAVDGAVTALAALGDPVRPDARAAIARLKSRGWKISILSGDHPNLVAAVGRSLGIGPEHCRGGASPEDKLALVQERAARSPVIMVGDGVNDAAALAAATVGIAVRGGAEASLAAADVSLSREGLAPILDLLDGAAHTMRTIHWTIATSLAYNVVAATLAIAGVISPLLAAIIMPASSLTVVALCFRSGAFRLHNDSNRRFRSAERNEYMPLVVRQTDIWLPSEEPA